MQISIGDIQAYKIEGYMCCIHL